MGSETEQPAVPIPDLSLEFVSKMLGKKIRTYTITPATAPGDNYNSVLYCLKCFVEGNNNEIVYAISKSYPSHSLRQESLNKSNTFWNEMMIYKRLIPTLNSFQEELGANWKLPFAQLISAEAVDFGIGKVNEERVAQYAGKTFEPFDIYLLMVDLKKTYGFRLADRFAGLGLDEVSLVMAEHSRVHALSWAYKLRNGVTDLAEKFEFLEFEMKEDDMAMMKNVFLGIWQTAFDKLKFVPGLNPGVIVGMEKFKGDIGEIMKWMFYDKTNPPTTKLKDHLRVKENKSEETRVVGDVPWRVIVHGDCWINNLLFRYDDVTKKAVELVLIDLQIMREGCPISDLVYLIYTSTSSEFRSEHLDDMLELYHSKFTFYCDELGVDYLPGYSLAAIKRRFHASKLLGFLLSLLVLQAVTKDSKDAKSMDDIKAEDMEEMYKSVLDQSNTNDLYTRRIVDLAQELFSQGVL